MSEVANGISTAPRVVIAIVATDEAKNLVGCLGSLNGSIYREFSVVICENGGHEAFERDVRELSKIPGMVAADAEAADRLGATEGQRFHSGADQRLVRVLRSRENRGYSGGVNFCIAAAGADWDFIWVLNRYFWPDARRWCADRRKGGYGSSGQNCPRGQWAGSAVGPQILAFTWAGPVAGVWTACRNDSRLEGS